MATYSIQPGDIAYRRVSLHAGKAPEFQEISAGDRQITYADDAVLEIQHADSSTEIRYDRSKQAVRYTIRQPDAILISACPTERLWIKEEGGARTLYKVPGNLPEDGANLILYLPGGINGAVLVGDEYFSAAYDILP